jgi:hypothetical protein
MQTVKDFWKASSGDMSWHTGRNQEQRPRVVKDHQVTLNSVARMWQVKVTRGCLCISACCLHVVSSVLTTVLRALVHEWLEVGK